ncbi:hypothetical protein H6F67_21965 [Microcoleus sp. FACHB-1515]|uniref:DNA methyltransferase n=1 Tax=Cyanophyceae TaxID=3028117 RepID=UPI001683380A|nr:DNA methyltransferase [Microcoleus sp. FACHB-1515]MBD2092519.1 hypothetical protein [Microcoleus sp. FACHB-1515]
MNNQLTLNLFPYSSLEVFNNQNIKFDRADLGTFKDSLRAPIHRWFTYPAGFSFKAVEEALRIYNIRPGMIVYDPFAGTGTTNVVAKRKGISSFGVEAHPFIQFVAQTKLFWEFDFSTLSSEIDKLISQIENSISDANLLDICVSKIFPELVCKCYSHQKLAQLYLCREAIAALPVNPFQNFARLGLTNLLRSIADVATGWPYIAPQKARKITKTTQSLNVVEAYRIQLYKMRDDLYQVQTGSSIRGNAVLISGDSRQKQNLIDDETVDLAFTSPPYLNNYDYADRTRLEMYFWGEASSWGDITRKVRDRLMMSATTQINRSDYNLEKLLSDDLCQIAPEVAAELQPKIAELSKLRLLKGGKKSYDIMVAGYFNDMLRVMRETYRVLRPSSTFIMILGDSAPYGIYIPTDVYLGEIGRAIGFASYKIENLRIRGGKWKDNPQRHDVALKECIVTLSKN